MLCPIVCQNVIASLAPIFGFNVIHLVVLVLRRPFSITNNIRGIVDNNNIHVGAIVGLIDFEMTILIVMLAFF